MKKLISLFLAVTMIFSFTVPAFATDATGVSEVTTDVVEEDSGFSIVRVFKIIWDAITEAGQIYTFEAYL